MGCLHSRRFDSSQKHLQSSLLLVVIRLSLLAFRVFPRFYTLTKSLEKRSVDGAVNGDVLAGRVSVSALTQNHNPCSPIRFSTWDFEAAGQQHEW